MFDIGVKIVMNFKTIGNVVFRVNVRVLLSLVSKLIPNMVFEYLFIPNMVTVPKVVIFRIEHFVYHLNFLLNIFQFVNHDVKKINV